MRGISALLPLCALGCAEPTALNPIETAKACIQDQVSDGQKVSAEMARQVINSCGTKLDAWSRYSIGGSFGRPFNDADPEMASAYAKHRAASQDYWLAHLSDEVAINPVPPPKGRTE